MIWTSAGAGDTMPHPRLPKGIAACLFDLDGVLTQTAKVHAAAWKEMFDAFLRARSEEEGEPFQAFEIATDYARYVDGLPREDGVRAFLASRDIELPEGTPDDPPDARTIHGLGARKNELFNDVLARDGVQVYDSSVRFVDAVRDAGIEIAVVTSSRNSDAVLRAAGLADRFEVRVDGNVRAARDLRGKPAPDTFLAAAQALGYTADRCAVFEDAVSGVEAGRAGAFGWVVGVDRAGQADALREAGADVVVQDLAELLEER
jgi:beta-phosphoglucomutase family hydrolase